MDPNKKKHRRPVKSGDEDITEKRVAPSRSPDQSQSQGAEPDAGRMAQPDQDPLRNSEQPRKY